MSAREQIQGTLAGAGRRFGIVGARFNERIADRLVSGAVDCLLRHGVDAEDIEVVRVPGAWEVPPALAELAAGGRFQGLVALGVLLRGETSHYEVLCTAVARGIAEVGERTRLPIGFGVLTCETTAQAEERAGVQLGNKGWEAALAALEMADLFARLRD
jgi:6,7-dimethyl-8-ribityllumazine synthase